MTVLNGTALVQMQEWLVGITKQRGGGALRSERLGEGGSAVRGGWARMPVAEGKHFDVEHSKRPQASIRPHWSLQNEANSPWRINSMTLLYLERDKRTLRLRLAAAVCWHTVAFRH